MSDEKTTEDAAGGKKGNGKFVTTDADYFAFHPPEKGPEAGAGAKGYYSYKLSPHTYALDTPTEGLEWDEDEHSIVIPFAALSKDRVGDVLEVDGIDFTNHRKNPVAFLDHALKQMKPIGRCVDREGNYTVWVKDGVAYAKIFLAWGVPRFPEPEQVFALYTQGILKAGSIGFRPTVVKVIPPDPEAGYFRPSKHVVRCELLEVSIVGLPANQDAVTKVLRDDTINGQPLTPLVRRTLKKCLCGVKRRAVALPTGMSTSKQMSAEDQATGGAVVADHTDEDQAVPHGAQVLKSLHEGMTACKGLIEEERPLMEHPEVTKLVDKMLPKLDKHIGEIADVHNEHYPDQPELPGAEGKDEDEGGESENPEDEQPEGEKSLSRADRQRLAALLVKIDGRMAETERKLRRWGRN